MEWLKINEAGEIEFNSEEVKLVKELTPLLSLAYNKGKGDFEGRKKTRAKNELKYLYLAYSPKSPYRDYEENERYIEAKLDCNFPDDWKESTELLLLIPKFIKGSQTKLARTLATAEKFLDKVDRFLGNVDLEERNENGALVNNPKTLMDMINQLPKVASTLQELEQQVRSGSVGNPKSKGDHEIGYLTGDDSPKEDGND